MAAVTTHVSLLICYQSTEPILHWQTWKWRSRHSPHAKSYRSPAFHIVEVSICHSQPAMGSRSLLLCSWGFKLFLNGCSTHSYQNNPSQQQPGYRDGRGSWQKSQKESTASTEKHKNHLRHLQVHIPCSHTNCPGHAHRPTDSSAPHI